MVSFISWNARGFCNIATVRRAKRLLRLHGCSLLAIYEPKCHVRLFSNYSRRLGCSNGVYASNGRIWVFWKHGLIGNVVHEHDQAITIRLSHPLWASAVLVTFVHGRCNRYDRRSLWDYLIASSEVNLPWLVAGDFNVILDQSEKIGGRLVRESVVAEFSDMIQVSSLIDAGFNGSTYTWWNKQTGRKRIMQRLDRVLFNAHWLDLFQDTHVAHLNKTCSDHSPLLVNIQMSSHGAGKAFRYLSVWAGHSSFMDLVSQSWESPIEGRPMVKFAKKLFRLRKVLAIWNRTTFGRIDQQVHNAEDEVLARENDFEASPSEEARAALSLAQANLQAKLKVEEDFWKQKANLKWQREGDKNTRFFQASVKKKRQKLYIHKIRNREGYWLTSSNDIQQEAVDFFSDQLQGELSNPTDDLLPLIPNIISPQENSELCRDPNMEELRDIIFSMNGSSAAGPDGFSGEFYKACWDIIRDDLLLAVRDFFAGFSLPRSWTSTLIVTIPKVDSPTSFSEMRPISLCNFSNKVITKLLNQRLALFLPRIISPQQSGFVPGRVIHENVLLAQELMHSLKKPNVRGWNVVLKLDMAKAYDRLSWFALIKVLRAFGFSEAFIDMIYRCISSCWFSVLVNGESCGFFHSSRGLRQGDPLSPTLFIIAAEVLSRGLNFLHEEYPFLRFRTHPNVPFVSHLAYADDVVIFCNGSKRSLEKHMQCLQMYQDFSGQLVSVSKSCYVTGRDVSHRDEVIANVTGFQRKELPIIYLGCPLYVGRKTISLFDGVVRKMRDRLAGWKGALLSLGAKIVLIKSCLQAIPLYTLSLIDPPKTVIRTMQRIITSFFWNGVDGQSKCHWLSWEKMALPIQEGGLGLRRFEDIAATFAMKLWWRIRGPRSLWSSFMLAKYCWETHPMDAGCPYFASHIWRRMIKVKDFMEERIGWRVGRGDISIHERWCLGSKPPLPFEHSTIASLFENSLPRADFIRANYGNQVLHLITSQVVRLRDLDDVIIWLPSTSGIFSTSSAWKEWKGSHNESRISSLCWHAHIPTKISVFMWRAIHRGLPTDEAVRKRGISIPSICVCCGNNPSMETLQHLFIQSRCASFIWNHFASLCGVKHNAHGFNQCLSTWWLLSNPPDGISKWVIRLIPCFILWEIWKHRNKAKYDNGDMFIPAIIEQIRVSIRDTFYAFYPLVDGSFRSQPIATYFQLVPRPKVIKPPRLVLWKYPSSALFKLNTDGASKGNPGMASGGGIFRDNNGDIFYAFSNFYGHHSNMWAEAMAAFDGIRLAYEFGIHSIWLEVDSEVLVKIIKGEYHIPWEIWYIIQQIKDFMGRMMVQVSHILREGNQVADGLANWAVKTRHSHVFQSANELPKPCQGPYRLDKALIPYYRL